MWSSQKLDGLGITAVLILLVWSLESMRGQMRAQTSSFAGKEPYQNLNTNTASPCFLKAGPVLAGTPVRGVYLGGDLRKYHGKLRT